MLKHPLLALKHPFFPPIYPPEAPFIAPVPALARLSRRYVGDICAAHVRNSDKTRKHGVRMYIGGAPVGTVPLHRVWFR